MLRELIDIAVLEDFASGLSRSAGWRVGVYDSSGELVVASAATNEFARMTGWVLGELPPNVDLVPVPAHDPPPHVGFVEHQGVWNIAAPVYTADGRAGFVTVGEFREQSLSGQQWDTARATSGIELEDVIRAWQLLPLLDRSGQSQPIITARWGARLLANWCQRESRLIAATDQVALVGDIAELLTGEEDLQTVLDRIVAETARVMQCPYASIRLYDAETNELRIMAVYNLSSEYVGKGAIVRTGGSVSDEALQGNIVYVEDVATDPRVLFSEEARQQGIVSVLTAGMVYRGSPVGVIRVYTNRRRRFRKGQRALLRAVAYQAATAIVHSQLVEERLRAADMQRQLELAGDLQARMVRIPPPKHPRLQTALSFNPSYLVGGDFCDILGLPDGRILAVVADVVGKGIPASLLMSSTRGALRAAAQHCTGPGPLLTQLNEQVCQETRPAEFVTILVIAVDPDTGVLTYANAGHEPLLILRKGAVTATDPAGLVLGTDPAEVYEERTIQLEDNDLLLLYTDGAIEARNFADEEYGRPRLHESLREHGQLHPELVLRNIVWDIRRFVGLAEQADDLTVVALRLAAAEASAT